MTYQAGLAVVPVGVKVACAQIVKNAQAMPALNVQKTRMDTLQMQYFSGDLLDVSVRSLLRPYVAHEGGLMSDLVRGSGAVARAADALLRTAGGRTVKLRVPAPGVPGNDATEQLGLAVPEFQDVELGSGGCFARSRATIARGEAPRYELLVSAWPVKTLVGSLAYESVAVLFGVIAGVLVRERLMFVESCTASEVGGEIYCYRLGLRGPMAVVV